MRVGDIIKDLKEIDREIILLHLEGYTDGEIAKILSSRQAYRRLVAPYTAKGIATRRDRALKSLNKLTDN